MTWIGIQIRVDLTWSRICDAGLPLPTRCWTEDRVVGTGRYRKGLEVRRVCHALDPNDVDSVVEVKRPEVNPCQRVGCVASRDFAQNILLTRPAIDDQPA